MEAPPSGEITVLIEAARAGRKDALDRLLDAVYPSFRTLASHLLRNERDDHTMQSTDLVHEAVIRLFLQSEVEMKNRLHMMALAGRQMRRILVEHARARLAQRRGGGVPTDQLVENQDVSAQELESLLVLDDLLAQLRQMDARAAEVVELRFFSGLSREEISDKLGVTVRTVQRDWDAARAWLLDALDSSKSE
ncbi:MAG: sigma-70 family RNA polymerase sigma factor [Acidobacteria bacterium]|nr:sigma-70 family RNA polymerase sigma factor [Acidobacteriota bacterium]